ncbi:MAG TPA: sulfatase [Candidatus Polarisedimenticolaceae bacterium]|nr:sulfatase [Candidatus Polarisedimenticolaceae bacterium]
MPSRRGGPAEPVRGLAAIAVGALLVAGCTGGERPTPGVVRLVDRFAAASIDGSPPAAAPGTVGPGWTFEGAAAAGGPAAGWQTHRVDGFAVRDGLLHGRPRDETSLIHAAVDEPADGADLLHAVEIAIRSEAGGELAIGFSEDDELDLDEVLDNPFPWPLRTPLVAAPTVERYSLRPTRATHLSSLRHLLIRPSGEFAIESVRVVSRREHLAAIESGVGWHGMEDVFREAIVTRSPEVARFEIDLPERPWLDLAVATIEEGAATFRVEARSAGEPPIVFERTVSRPHRWSPVRIDLAPLAGRRVTLSLALEAPQPRVLGFWGTAVVRRSSDPVAQGTPPARPHGVIVMLADTLRADHLDRWGYGRETSPQLSELARDGVTASDCISQATWTKVSVPSIFTSLYPRTHTVAEFTDRLPASADTLAEQFRRAGHATLALTSIPFAGQFTNLHQGYEELHESSSLLDSPRAKTAREYVDRLLPWLDEHRDVPFFVFLHVADPHSPYRVDPPYDTWWGDAGDADRLEQMQEQVRPLIDNATMRRFGMPTRSELTEAGIDPERYVDHELDAYDGSIRAMDVELGRLLERLAELGLADRTVLAFVSDHGTEFLDHDAHFHGHTVYGELNRVPLLLWGPSFLPRGVVLEPTVQTIDLMPTLLELAGLESPARAQGRSLLPLISDAERGEPQRWPHPAITEKARLETRNLPGRRYESMSLIADGWKLVRHRPAPAGIDEFELYDHRRDPLNLDNVASRHPERLRELDLMLRAWESSVLAARLDDAALDHDLDPQELERLRSLGYLQ